MASSLLDPAAQHAADIVQSRGLGVPDRNALMAGVLSQRTPKLGLFSKDSKGKERDLRVFLFNCAIVLLTPNPNEKEKGWVLFCEPIPIEILTLRAIRAPPSTPATPQARRRSWFLDRVPAAPIPARAKTPPPGKARSSTPPSAANGIADDFSLVLSTLGRKDPNRTWPITLHAADAVEQRAWAQCVSERQEEIRVNGRDGSIRGWGLVPVKVAALGNSPVTCYVDYDEGFTKARLWGTPDGLYEHILNAPNQATAARKILDLPGITHVLVMDFDERLMIVLVAEQTAYLAPFPGPSAMLEVSRLKKIGSYITHIAAGVLVSQPTLPANAAPSAFIDPEEKRERRKSATLTKPPPRGAVLSGASSTKSEVPSIVRKDKDKESVKAPVVVPAAPGPVAAPSPTTTASSLARPASPVKSKDKEKKPRRLSDIGLFSLWKRKPEKDKKKDKPRASTTSPSSAQTAFKPSPIDETPKPSLNVPRMNQAATAKTESAVSSLKPSVDFEGPQLTKVKSSTLPMPMRLPSFEFDRSEAKDESKPNGNGTEDKPADETGTLTGLGRPSIASQTVPSRASTGGSGLGRLARKLTTDSTRTTSSRPKELGPPPTIQIALDFPSIAWPSLETESRDPFAASDFLADVQKDIGVLLSEEKVGVISEEPERASASGSAEGGVKETGNGHVEGNGEAKENGNCAVEENGNGAVKESASEAPAPEATESVPVPPLVAQTPSQVPAAIPPVGSPRPGQPQHTRFLVLSKSTTLSTTVKLFTVGGLKIEDDGDIGGGRLTFYRELYMPSQTYSIDMLKSRICFGSNDGFQIVDPTTLDLQPFLDPVEAADADGPLGFLIKHPRRPKARQVFRVDQKFLCCYDDFAFFLDKFGKRAREDWFVKWQGNPTSFAVQYPYLFAFEPEFTEIRHCATGELLQLIPQPNSKRLPAGDFIAPAQKLDGVPNRRLGGEIVLESEGSLYALRPL